MYKPIFLTAVEAFKSSCFSRSQQQMISGFSPYVYSWSDLPTSESAFQNIFSKKIPDKTLPTLGFILLHFYENANNKEKALNVLSRHYKKVVEHHRFLYEHHDPLEEGLVTSRPICDNKLEGLVQDPFFNALLCWSNESLIKIGGLLGIDVLEIIHWQELSIFSMNEKLWDENNACYSAYDLKREEKIPLSSLSAFMPLIAEIPTQDQAELMLERLYKNYYLPDLFLFCQNPFPAEKTREKVSVFFNWLLYKGFQRYDMEEEAEMLCNAGLQFMDSFGEKPWHTPLNKLAAMEFEGIS